jgi:hypothetical protein
MAKPRPSGSRPGAAGKVAAYRAAQRRAERRRRALRALAVLVGAAVVVAIVVFAVQRHHSRSASAALGPEGVPLQTGEPLAAVDTSATGQPVDGVRCDTSEQVAYHIHSHLAVFVSGQPRSIPAGVGVAPPRQTQNTPSGPFVVSGACFYWLHTHASDGILHVESPLQQDYTLGNFFDIWRQPLNRDQVGPARGAVTVFVDGQQQSVDPRLITLTAHAVIQLDVGTPVVPFQTITFPSGL